MTSGTIGCCWPFIDLLTVRGEWAKVITTSTVTRCFFLNLGTNGKIL